MDNIGSLFYARIILSERKEFPMSLNLNNMSTESRNRNTMDLDLMTPLEIVTVMNQEDA